MIWIALSIFASVCVMVGGYLVAMEEGRKPPPVPAMPPPPLPVSEAVAPLLHADRVLVEVESRLSRELYALWNRTPSYVLNGEPYYRARKELMDRMGEVVEQRKNLAREIERCSVVSASVLDHVGEGGVA